MTPDASQPNKPSPILIIFLIFPIIGIVAALAMMVSSGGTAGGVPPTPAPVTLANPSVIGQSAPNFELEELNGDTIRLSSYRGRIVLLNFWATWCEPCKRELPAFADFNAEQGADGAIVLAVNAGETPEQVTEYFTEHHLENIPLLMDSDLAVYDLYNIQLLPTTYVIDATGVVRYMHLGELTVEDFSGYMAELSAEG
jgi:peroxiredoxin